MAIETAEEIAEYLQQRLAPLFQGFKLVVRAGESIGAMDVEASFYRVPASTSGHLDLLNAPVSIRTMIYGGSGWKENRPPPKGLVQVSTLTASGWVGTRRLQMPKKTGTPEVVINYMIKWFQKMATVLKETAEPWKIGRHGSLRRIVTAHQRQAASEIKKKDLPASQMVLLELAQKAGARLVQAWDGINGYILDCRGNGKITPEILRDLIRDPDLRWLSIDGKSALAQLPTDYRGNVVLGRDAGAGSWRITKAELKKWTSVDDNRTLKFRELTLGC